MKWKYIYEGGNEEWEASEEYSSRGGENNLSIGQNEMK